MENNIILDGVNYFIDGTINNFNIKGKVTVYIVNIDFKELSFNMEDSSELKIINFCEINNDEKIVINEKNDSYFKYVSNIDVKDSYNLNISLNMLGSNSKSDILISGVIEGKTVIKVDSFDLEKTQNNEINENIKLLNDGGIIHVEPILRVGARNVIANHSNSITNIDENYMFYLKSKGIRENIAKKLIVDSYRYGLISKYDEVLNKIKR